MAQSLRKDRFAQQLANQKPASALEFSRLEPALRDDIETYFAPSEVSTSSRTSQPAAMALYKTIDRTPLLTMRQRIIDPQNISVLEHLGSGYVFFLTLKHTT